VAHLGEKSRKLKLWVEDKDIAPTMRKPFDILAEGPILKKNRGDRTPVELFATQIGLWNLEAQFLFSQ